MPTFNPDLEGKADTNNCSSVIEIRMLAPGTLKETQRIILEDSFLEETFALEDE